MSEEELKHYLGEELASKYAMLRDLRPVRKGDFIGVEQDKFYVQLSEEEIYELSPLAYYIWALCDGEHRVDDIARDISENARVAYYEVIEPLVVVLEEMKKAGLVAY
ncbi:MAG: PqqD family protein [Desulfurococcaceae archaeon]